MHQRHRTPLVMVHGATADHTALSSVIPLLESDYTVHVVAHMGHSLIAGPLLEVHSQTGYLWFTPPVWT